MSDQPQVSYAPAIDWLLNAIASEPGIDLPGIATLVTKLTGIPDGNEADPDTRIVGLLAEALRRITAARAVMPSRLGAGTRLAEHEAAGDGPDLVFYSGASFALARVGRALRGVR